MPWRPRRRVPLPFQSEARLPSNRYNCSLAGVFISFEGIDGSGKTTQLHRLSEMLTGQGHEVIVAREPGGTRVGNEIRRLLLDAASTDLRPVPELLLYFASRAQNIAEVIGPALAAGKIVLVDRFTDATVAYQGCGRDLGVETVRAVEQVACRGLKPDLTLFLDIDPAVALPRARARNAVQAQDESRMERQSLSFYEKVRQAYLDLCRQEPQRVRLVSGSGDADEVAARVIAVAEAFLASRFPGPYSQKAPTGT